MHHARYKPLRMLYQMLKQKQTSGRQVTDAYLTKHTGNVSSYAYDNTGAHR